MLGVVLAENITNLFNFINPIRNLFEQVANGEGIPIAIFEKEMFLFSFLVLDRQQQVLECRALVLLRKVYLEPVFVAQLVNGSIPQVLRRSEMGNMSAMYTNQETVVSANRF